ncbi:MAG TPA: hypothetical protein VHJ20_21020, partial [Polyangia bacterium]|nr:hypothetical protein [Polyangia bacterium]
MKRSRKNLRSIPQEKRASAQVDRTGHGDRKDGGFDELDHAFFDAAPPEVAVAPPPAARFDDLDGPLPARLARPRQARVARA